jgi:serine/threonine-protein kinase
MIASRMGERATPAGDTIPTVMLPAAGGAAAAPPSDRLAGAGASTEQAMFQDETQRVRLFVTFAVAIAVASGAGLFVLGGNPTAREIHLAGLGVALAGVVWFALATRRHGHHPWQITVLGHVFAVVVIAALPYWGLYSGAIALIPFGATMFMSGRSVGAAVSLTAVNVVGHGTLSCLIVTGVLPDAGLLRMPDLPLSRQLLIIGLIEFIFVATFFVARGLRRSHERTLQDAQDAARQLALADAQLAEARQELRAAQHVGGLGRYSGQTIGSYKLTIILGRGAMGDVYEAHHTRTDAACAVKLLHPHVISDPTHYQRFLREADIAARLDVDNVVKVLEVARGDSSLPFLAMERLDGADLATHLTAHPQMPLGEVVDMIRGVGAGLAAAHAAGIVHRDLKPQNIFRHADGRRVVWKILDFGVSKLAESGNTLTAGHIVGTPAYMAPEQADGKGSDHRSDVYALGVVAYRALTGRPPFGGDDPLKVMYAIVHHMPPRPGGVRALPRDIDDALAVALAKDPALRFDSGPALADALAAAAAGALPTDLRERAERILRKQRWSDGK